MQLSGRPLAVGLVLAASRWAVAQSGEVDAYSTLFYEFGGPLEMMVVTPSARARVTPVPEVTVRAGWDADVVSGASVAVVDAPSAEVDAIASATRLYDFRNVFSGGVEVRADYARFRGSYAYGFENDYRSHSFSLGANAELFSRNTVLDLSYARGFDAVCDTAQPRDQKPVDRRRLDSSAGCFSDRADRASRDVSLSTFQGSWTQAWTPIFVTQVTVTAQLIDGFQSNPYRAVWLGRSAAQEHHPEERLRYAAGAGLRLWVEALESALTAQGRVYRDNWDVRSVSAEVGYELSLGGALRIRLRGRYYLQGAAAFYSDDYAFSPRGQYFTGDRELADMQSFLAGGRVTWSLTPGTDGASLGPLQEFRLALAGDWIRHEFPNFRYGGAPVPNVNSIFATLGLEFMF